MKWLEGEAKEQGLSLREVGDRIGYHNASRVGQYFRQKIVAGPDMVRRLALAVGVSPIDALWRSGHYSEVFDYLDNLYRLGWSWLREDQVGLDQDAGALFTLQYAKSPVEGDIDLTDPHPSLSHRYHQGVIHNPEIIFQMPSLPKPMACAILLGVGLFPRRGDVLRDETKDFIWKLTQLVSSDVLPLAERISASRNVPYLRQSFKGAEGILVHRYYPAPMRLSIVAEYVHNWCDVVCHNYANFARLALYTEWGFVGDADAERDLWSHRHAALPSLDDLRITQ